MYVQVTAGFAHTNRKFSVPVTVTLLFSINAIKKYYNETDLHCQVKWPNKLLTISAVLQNQSSLVHSAVTMV